MTEFLFTIYPWVKSLHIMAVISWMAGLFYLPRLFVHHVEQAKKVQGAPEIFLMMQEKLLKIIMRPAMIVTWVCGLIMVFTPGIVDWSWIWPWTKGASVLAMTWFHHWLLSQHRNLEEGTNTLSGRTYRLMNEVPTVLMVVIVLSVILKF
ncbi:CopD family protein [Tropicibacter sp. Alg240-R139]|uniref:CopD family protein n=1 Tax=Tropicibacter sp. Alg240-R139 TaxID=2305991 RepID=UPI0013E09B2F|nr:CopD family protein [Tropicibacter sp. Alg240-R139]